MRLLPTRSVSSRTNSPTPFRRPAGMSGSADTHRFERMNCSGVQRAIRFWLARGAALRVARDFAVWQPACRRACRRGYQLDSEGVRPRAWSHRQTHSGHDLYAVDLRLYPEGLSAQTARSDAAKVRRWTSSKSQVRIPLDHRQSRTLADERFPDMDRTWECSHRRAACHINIIREFGRGDATILICY
jgi:hypothetical protein